jgi:hypothetical protein
VTLETSESRSEEILAKQAMLRALSYLLVRLRVLEMMERLDRLPVQVMNEVSRIAEELARLLD